MTRLIGCNIRRNWTPNSEGITGDELQQFIDLVTRCVKSSTLKFKQVLSEAALATYEADSLQLSLPKLIFDIDGSIVFVNHANGHEAEATILSANHCG